MLGQRQLENIITTLNMITNRNNYDKIDSMKKLHIQKCITWCEKHDISCIKLYASNNIFLSTIYDDGTPISFLKNNSNAFLKGKSSNFTNNIYIGGGGGQGASKGKSSLSSPLQDTILKTESSKNEVVIEQDCEINDTGEINEATCENDSHNIPNT